VTLPFQQAWFEGRLVSYVSTDVSDADRARSMDLSHVPQLAAAANPNRGYSPLWLLVLEQLQPGHAVQTLRSEEAVLAATERGALRLTRTTVVANCPVVVDADGRALPGSRAN